MKNSEITALQTRLNDIAGKLLLFERIFDHGKITLCEDRAQALSEDLLEHAEELQQISAEFEQLKKPLILKSHVKREGRLLSFPVTTPLMG